MSTIYNHIETKNKRIASNTVILFIRMIIIMVINLYTVRIILKGLGEEDYGIFNAISGVVLTSTFIPSTLANAIQRFYSFSLGINSKEQIKKIFSASINISLILTIAIVLILEFVGVWFINTQMTIPTERLYAAEIIFHITVAGFAINLIQVPFTASVFSHEDMNIYAIISMIDCFGRLTIAILMTYFITIDHLVFYSSGLFFVCICIFIFYFTVSLSRYNLKYLIIKEKAIYKKLLSFSSYTMYGTIAGVGMIQGTTILLNIFFGPLTNAAYNIGNQIYNAINALNNSIILSFRPAMIKSYASNEYSYLKRLFYASNKFLLYAMLCIAIPTIFEMPSILLWWLGDNISKETIIFSQLFVIYCVIIAMHNPITIIIQASGNIKYYYICVETITIMCLPITWVFFKLGMPAYGAFVSMISTGLLSHIIRIKCLKKNLKSFSYREYINMALIALVILLVASFCCYFIQTIPQNSYRVLMTYGITTTIILLLVFLIAINKEEKKMIKLLFKQLFTNK